MAASLPVQHLLNLIQQLATTEPTPPDLEKLQPGHMRLYSYYKPALEAGIYGVTVKQDISAKDQHLYLENFDSNVNDNDMTKDDKTIIPQMFEVVASQFNLDPEIINSYYPPDGHADEGAILPHICFNDPHLPWERVAGTKPTMEGPIDFDSVTNKKRSMVPWVALLVFDPEELALTAEEIIQLDIPGFFKEKITEIDTTKLPQSGAYPMAVKDYLSLAPASRVAYEHGYPDGNPSLQQKWQSLKTAPDQTSIIFPKKSLVRDIFMSDGVPDPEFCKYLAHVRHIKTTGFPDAGIEQDGLYSIVMSHRTGPTKIEDTPGPPKTQIVHLISIEHMDSTLSDFGSGAALEDRIGVVSLYSWIYTALPPNPVNFTDTMESLADNMQLLRPVDATLNKLQGGSLAEEALFARLKSGYTISRWRTESGEETAAFNRGPLTPIPTKDTPTIDPNDWPTQSMTGKNYQILDPTTGLMDLSYSSAWQLGKLLAIGDGSFSAALARFRAFVTTSAASNTRQEINKTPTKSAIASNISSMLASAKNLSSGNTGFPQRLTPASSDPLAATQLRSSDIAPVFAAHVQQVAQKQATVGQDGEIYNGVNIDGANNSDWALIHDWLYNKLFLIDIPAYYLFVDSTHTPTEGLRFFHIDNAWLDAFIDGALSVANHFDPENDKVRVQIKELFNTYLTTPVETAGLATKVIPQVPTWGFILRSALLKVMPDMRITVTWKTTNNGYSICRLTRLDDNTVLCLLDRRPEDLLEIEFAQPPHQQRFKAGYNIDKDGILEIMVKHLYTSNPPTGTGHELEWPNITGAELNKPNMPHVDTTSDGQQKQPGWYTQTTRCLDVKRMVKELNDQVQLSARGSTAPDNRVYNDKVPTSVILGLELNDSSKYILFKPPIATKTPPVLEDGSQSLRQLWTGRKKVLVSEGKSAIEDSSVVSKTAVAKELSPQPLRRVVQPTAVQPVAQAMKVTPPAINVKVTTTQAAVGGPLAPSTRYSNIPEPPETFLVDNPQFYLSLGPDYKAIAPPPLLNVYNPTDFIPTRAEFLLDLVFALTRTNPNLNQLREVAIDIPTMGAWKADKRVEPLLDGYDGPGMNMLGGQRFTPMLSKSDKFLTCRLIPRSSSVNPAMDLMKHPLPNGSFRLGECRIAEIKNAAQVFVKGNNPKKPDIVKGVGVCSVWVREFYFDRGAIKVKRQEFRIIKRDTDDVDINGNAVPMLPPA